MEAGLVGAGTMLAAHIVDRGVVAFRLIAPPVGSTAKKNSTEIELGLGLGLGLG